MRTFALLACLLLGACAFDASGQAMDRPDGGAEDLEPDGGDVPDPDAELTPPDAEPEPDAREEGDDDNSGPGNGGGGGGGGGGD